MFTPDRLFKVEQQQEKINFHLNCMRKHIYRYIVQKPSKVNPLVISFFRWEGEKVTQRKFKIY